MNDLASTERRIMYYIYHAGPTFARKLSVRLREEVGTILASIELLKKAGYLKRVSKALVDYRIDRRNKVTKHRNHTYFDLTRKGRLLVRSFGEGIEVDLRPTYRHV